MGDPAGISHGQRMARPWTVRALARSRRNRDGVAPAAALRGKARGLWFSIGGARWNHSMITPDSFRDGGRSRDRTASRAVGPAPGGETSSIWAGVHQAIRPRRCRRRRTTPDRSGVEALARKYRTGDLHDTVKARGSRGSWMRGRGVNDVSRSGSIQRWGPRWRGEEGVS